MSAFDYATLKCHLGHKLQCVQYGDGDNVAIECIDCHEVLLDYNKPEDHSDLIRRMCERFSSEDLDDHVHAFKSIEASGTNNDGQESQVKFLIEAAGVDWCETLLLEEDPKDLG